MTRSRFPRRRIFACLLALFALALAVDFAAFPYGRWNAGLSRDGGENGLWLRYSWYFGQHSPAETQALAQRLVQEHIRYAFFHVRSVRSDGRLAFHHLAEARRLAAELHRDAPGVKVIAWVYAGNAQGLGRVDLSQPTVRRAMVGEAQWLTTACGFDGVQWDYEVCASGDQGLISLLRETRAALGPGKLLSVAASVWLPRPLQHWGWQDDYITEVAANCDQIAVMGYDTGACCRVPTSGCWAGRSCISHRTRRAAIRAAGC